MKPQEQKVIYYSDELNDEFSEAVITPRKIDESYKYDGIKFLRPLERLWWYWLVFKPGSFVYLKLVYHHKIVNKKCLRAAKGKAYFIYGNHTHAMADPYIPTHVAHPKSTYVIVHANNVSIPFLGKIVPSLGGLPLPDTFGATKNFVASIEDKVKHNKCICIYPEAHIWPYYTKIRPFKDASFRYPVQYKTPVFCFTNTYQKRKHSSRPRIVTYVDGPFYADQNLSAKEQRAALRNAVYEKMCERSKNNSVELIHYIKKEEAGGSNISDLC